VIDELLELSPTISDPQEVVAGNRNRASDADLRPLEPFPQAPQSRDPRAADPGPVNPEDNRRLSVDPQVEVEPTADVCPSGPARDAGDQGRDGRIIWAGSRSKPARQGRRRGRSFDSGHGNRPPAHPTKDPPANPSSSTRVDRATHVPFRALANAPTGMRISIKLLGSTVEQLRAGNCSTSTVGNARDALGLYRLRLSPLPIRLPSRKT
jgi:hypothetical protein